MTDSYLQINLNITIDSNNDSNTYQTGVGLQFSDL